MTTQHKNTQLQELIRELRQASHDAPLWKAVALQLERPTRHRPIVNLANLNRFTKQGEVIVVPGKVLGDGEVDHSITVAALGFSSSAEQKLKQSKSSLVTIQELLKKDPKAKTVRVFA